MPFKPNVVAICCAVNATKWSRGKRINVYLVNSNNFKLNHQQLEEELLVEWKLNVEMVADKIYSIAKNKNIHWFALTEG